MYYLHKGNLVVRTMPPFISHPSQPSKKLKKLCTMALTLGKIYKLLTLPLHLFVFYKKVLLNVASKRWNVSNMGKINQQKTTLFWFVDSIITVASTYVLELRCVKCPNSVILLKTTTMWYYCKTFEYKKHVHVRCSIVHETLFIYRYYDAISTKCSLPVSRLHKGSIKVVTIKYTFDRGS